MNHADDDRRIVVSSSGNDDAPRATNQRRTVLAEEEYDSTLSHIVTRDYFPSLHSLRRDAAVLDARARGDVAGAVAARREARRKEEERERDLEEERAAEEEAASETALVTRSGIDATLRVRKRPRPLKHESITGFHARVTSEDNAEFEMNQERERREREKNLGVVYSARADKGGRLMIEACVNDDDGGDAHKRTTLENDARTSLCDTPLGLSSDLYDAPPSAGLRITDGGDAKNDDVGSNGIGRNGLFFQPRHLPGDQRTDPSSKKLLLTSGAPSGGTFLALENGATSDAATEGDGNVKCDNLLMPPPPARLPAPPSSVVPFQSDDSSAPKSNESAPPADRRAQLVEYLPKPSLPDIHPPATRFPYQEESRLLAINTGAGGIVAGRNHSGIEGSYTSASETTDLDASPPPLDSERAARGRAHRRERETFVAMTPLIRPGGGGDVADGGGGSNGAATTADSEPIMTWGDVASTPLVLGGGAAADGRPDAGWEPTRPASAGGGGSSGAPAFDVADDNARERMARRAERGLADRGKTYRAAGRRCWSTKARDEIDDGSVCSSRSTTSASTAPFDRAASLTPAARALLEASNDAHRSRRRFGGRPASSSSRIFHASSVASRSSSGAGSRESFGSALRASYAPGATPRNGGGGGKKGKGSSSSSSLRRAAGGATPRCRSLR